LLTWGSYVGTLHEINPEQSTIALENVVSHGTEGRRNGEGEIAPSSSVYEYIVFRGSDVKDISVVEDSKENKPPEPPQVPDDPAILGVSGRLHRRIRTNVFLLYDEILRMLITDLF
jgi:protein LSM14